MHQGCRPPNIRLPWIGFIETRTSKSGPSKGGKGSSVSATKPPAASNIGRAIARTSLAALCLRRTTTESRPTSSSTSCVRQACVSDNHVAPERSWYSTESVRAARHYPADAKLTSSMYTPGPTSTGPLLAFAVVNKSPTRTRLPTATSGSVR